MQHVLKKLQGGDRRSIGRVDEVVADVRAEPSLFDIVFQGMFGDDPLVRMRCADAVEKITLDHPEYLRPYKDQLLSQAALVEQQEVRWHVALLFSRLQLSQQEQRAAVGILTDYLHDDSKIVKTFAMQGLADIALQDDDLRKPIIRQLEALTHIGSPAMQSRGRRLLKKLRSDQ